jgi:Ca-activated chloride channel family protein
LKEAEKLRATVATKAKVDIKVAEGVTIDRVFDRAFQRTTLGVAVPLGNFSADDTLTVLLELHVPTDLEGEVPIATAKLYFDDRAKGGEGSCEGKLATFVTTDPASVSELDPFVAARLARSKTAGVLLEVNELLEKGDVEGAKVKLEAHEKALAETETKAQAAAPAPRREALQKDFKGQASTISGVRQSIGKPGGADKAGVKKRNVEAMNPYML